MTYRLRTWYESIVEDDKGTIAHASSPSIANRIIGLDAACAAILAVKNYPLPVADNETDTFGAGYNNALDTVRAILAQHGITKDS